LRGPRGGSGERGGRPGTISGTISGGGWSGRSALGSGGRGKEMIWMEMEALGWEQIRDYCQMGLCGFVEGRAEGGRWGDDDVTECGKEGRRGGETGKVG